MLHSLRCAWRPFVVFVSFCVSSTCVLAGVVPTGASVPNEVLIKVRAGAVASDVAGIAKLADSDQTQSIARLKGGVLMRLRSRSLNTETLIEALKSNPNVEFVEPNYIVKVSAPPNDPLYGSLWGLENTGQNIESSAGTTGADIDAPGAWSITKGSHAVVVAVIDTGVDYTHPDLAANMWTNSGGKGNAACAAGTFGYNAINDTCDPKDDNGHGTHIAGTIGAVGDNGTGVTGVNWTASIMALKFLNSSGNGTTADAIEAIEFAIQAKLDGVNVRVLSNSWGGGAFSKALLDVITQASENDILFVASAGNNSTNTDTSPQYPSAFATPNMIAVAATDNRDRLAWFSNWGATTVHLAAPGAGILSTIRDGGYGFLSGTSMAAAHVSGVAALVLVASPSFTTAQVKNAILSSADPLPNLAGLCTTGGRLNAAKAVGGTASPDFVIGINPALRNVPRGGTVTYPIAIMPQNGFAGAVDLTISGLPSGTTASFTPSTTTTMSTLTVVTSSSTPQGGWTLTITGTSGALTRSALATLSVESSAVVTACPYFSVSSGLSGGMPTSVTIADLNGDGRSDYALTNVSLNTVQVLYAPLTSTFAAFSVGRGPVALISADLNGDGRLDLATANSLSNDISVLLRNNNGSFDAAVQYPTGNGPFAITTGDFNRDGKADLAVANNGSSNVSILLGQTGGTFGAATQFTAGSGPFWVTAADLDADGRTDLAVANFRSDTVSILRGNGDGTFGTRTETAAGSKPSSLAAGDFDGDGKTDLAVSNYGSNNVSLLSGNGDGSFDAAVNFAVGASPSSIAAGDLDGDGKLDLVTSNPTSYDVSILFADGFGSFKPAMSILISYETAQATIGDWNDDGRPDILVATPGAQRVYYIRNFGSCTLNCGALSNPGDVPAGSSPQSAAAGDFNGDGNIDLAIADAASSTVITRIGSGDGTFTPGAVPAAGSSPRGIITRDFDRDGKLDLAVASAGSNEVAILLGNGDGTWKSQVLYATGLSPRALAAGDFNRDGKTDLAIATRDSNAVSVLLGGVDGTFGAPANYGVGSHPEGVATADFNQDGLPDLAVTNADSANTSILLGNGDGTFQTAVNVAAGSTPRGIIAGDFNGDGKADLATANSGSNDITFLAGNGNGTFKAAVTYATGISPRALLALDLNADGRVDLVTANASHDASVLLSVGGAWGTASSIATGTGSVALTSGDFNRDGRPDVVTVNNTAASLSTLLNTCPLPDLTVTKTHSGTFEQGATGNYTITVSNSGQMVTNGTVTVKDTLPEGLAPAAMSGTGWECMLATTMCSRSDVLAAGASYPPITLTVRINGRSPLSVTNMVSVSGGGEVFANNDTASDLTPIVAKTDLLLLKSHTGSFTQGATGRKYALVVRNSGGLASSGLVTVTDSLPAGLTATAIMGIGWSCNLNSTTCTRSDALAAGASYPPIEVTVSIASNAPYLIVNTATITGGGDATPANNTAVDPTTVWSTSTCGSFGSASSYYASSTSGLVIADFNNDGKSDIAVAGGYNGSVIVRLGSGDGSFLDATTYQARNPIAIASGDLNHDGKLDIVTTSNEYESHISILLGNGDGSFTSVPDSVISNGAYLGTVLLVDLDRDGHLDVVSSTTYYSSSNLIFVLFGNGDGTLRPAATFSLGTGSSNWNLADVDSDGSLDILVTASSSWRVFLGNGDGTFQTELSSPRTESVGAIATGDLNGDGKLDIAAAGYDSATIFLGNGDGTFGTGVAFPTYYSSNGTIILADINGDGKLDVLTGGYYISTLLGNGDGTFQTPNFYYGDSSRIAVADLNKDGRADLVYASYSGFSVRLGGCADPAITMGHYGNFVGGYQGSYTIQVSNAGAGAMAGTVTVTDTLPAGLVYSSYSNSYEWNCTTSGQTRTCTRTGSLPTDGYPWSLQMYVDVLPTAPTSVTNVATLSFAGDTNLTNNTASDPTTVVQSPDLTITSSHTGTWTPGQNGTYTLTVGNNGTASTSGTVTVTDTPPPSFSALSMSGPGWSCSTYSCSRNDALAPTAIYPPITMVVSVLPGASTANNTASVTVEGERYPYDNTVYDQTRILAIPGNVVATASSPAQVTVTWYRYDPQGVVEVFRATGNGPYSQVGSTLGGVFYDNNVVPNTVYWYRARAVAGSVISPLSTPDFTTTAAFTDDPITAGITPVKAIHLEELRSAINAVRATANLAAISFSNSVLTGLPVTKNHVTEVRDAINLTRQQIGSLPIEFADSGSIEAAHINALRAALK